MRKRKEGWNADKHGCKQCKYAVRFSGASEIAGICCDYLEKTGKMRSKICSGADCAVFEPMESRKGKKKA